ncbi:MAG TPA: AMP-binding protein [Trebonia sp.]|jgi:fatty-acyl-CoA synthase|nr:AMP-binding protein [Trebonia sp.]
MPEFTLSKAYWPADVSSPVQESTIGSVLREAAERTPHATALIDGNPDGGPRRAWTYRELLDDAECAARALLTRFRSGERVAVWSANSPEWVILEFAAALAGLALVTVNPAYQAEELAHVLGHSEADGLVLADTYQQSDLHAILAAVRTRLPRLREVISFSDWDAFVAAGDANVQLPEVAPADIAHVLYTSGTTGRPKGALLTHRGLTNSARLAFQGMGVCPSDIVVNPMPLFHVGGGTLFTLGPLQVGAAHVLMPKFSPGLQLELIERYRGTILCGVPTMLIAVMGHSDLVKRDVSSLRIAMSGGALAPPALVRQVEAALGVSYVIGYAQTETHCGTTLSVTDDLADDRAETVGRPLPNIDLRIADPTTGTTAACGEIGEIRTRGFNVMHGYLNAPEATAAAFDTDGWLRTGDLGSMDERGYVRIAGRLKEMIIRGGENVYPREIEEVLIRHQAVVDAAVLGIPDDHYGEVVAAAICPTALAVPSALDRDALVGELADLCHAHLAAYKTPVRWLITDGFPLTPSGKIRKDVLRDMLMAENKE